MKKNYAAVIGRISAMAIVVETVVFAIALIWEVFVPSEFVKYLGYVASLLIAPSVVLMMACFYDGIQGQLRIFGLLALVSSVIYATFCVSTYFLQMAVVALNPIDLTPEVIKIIEFVPGSPTFAIDMLGYGFLCLSTLAAGFALTAPKDKWLQVLNFFHGAIAVPTFAAPIISGIFRSTPGEANAVGNYVLLFWCVVFIPIALLFMQYFRRA